MATASRALKHFNLEKDSNVAILDDPLDSNKIAVKGDPFGVSKGKKERAEWQCLRPHDHTKNSPCFTIKFIKNGCPFETNIFCADKHGHAVSTPIRDDVQPSSYIYEYMVETPDKSPLDPGGGVKP